MEKTKLKSLRISERTLSKVDDFVSKERYYKSHGVMVAIIENVFEYADNQTILAIIRQWRFSARKMKITVQYETDK